MSILASLRSVRGEWRGIPKLTLDLGVESQLDVRLVIINLTVEMWVTKVMAEPDMSKSYFIGAGFLEPTGTLQLSQRGKGSWQVAFPLSPYQLQKIEEMRAGKDLFLNTQWFCTAGYQHDPQSKTITDICLVQVSVPGYGGVYCPFKIPQSDWVKNLKDLGYGDYILMEIPLKGVPDRRGMQKAVEHLKAAWEHFEQGNDDETLGSCYKAFEYLAKKCDCKDPDQNAFEKILSTIPEEEKRRRLKLLMHYICHFLSLGRHEPGTEAVMLDGRESEYGLILSQASLSYLAKMMRETAAK
jgi:hypothetical protein